MAKPMVNPKVKKLANGYTLECSISNCGNKYPLPPCEHLNAWLEVGYDASDIQASTSVMVYATHGNALHLPDLQWLGWTRVDVGTDLKGGFKEITLNHTRMDSSRFETSLGLASQYDGRYTFAVQIMDTVLSRLDPQDKFKSKGDLHTKCKSNLHSPRQEKLKKEFERRGAPARIKMMFALALEGACVPCLNDAFGESDDNFGLDRVDDKNGAAPFDPAAQVAAPPIDVSNAVALLDEMFPIGSDFRGGKVTSKWVQVFNPLQIAVTTVSHPTAPVMQTQVFEAEAREILERVRTAAAKPMLQISKTPIGLEYNGGEIIEVVRNLDPVGGLGETGTLMHVTTEHMSQYGVRTEHRWRLDERGIDELHSHLRKQGFRG